ncbi:MAG: ComF family protein [Acidobacteriota bacterium]
MSSYGSDRVRVTLRRLVRLVVPDPCLACGLAHASASEPPLGLCSECRRRLRPAPETTCLGCGRPFDGAVDAPTRCGACRRRPPAWEVLVWAWTYAEPLDTVVAGLKFGRLDYLGEALGQAAADVAGRRLRGPDVAVARCDAVVPVPLHWRRRMVRGFDQAERIATGVADELGLPLWSALRRRRATRPQSLEARAPRRRRLADAFVCRYPERIAGRRLLLVDDVLTTGATLDAAARTLVRGGARVAVLVVARTPAPDESGVETGRWRLASQGLTS